MTAACPTAPTPATAIDPTGPIDDAARRAAEWNGALKPFDDFERWLVEVIAR